MKQSEIQIGKFYRANVSNQRVTVRVDGIRKQEKFRERKRINVTVFDVTNLRTNKELTFDSAQRFLSETTPPSLEKPKITSNQPPTAPTVFPTSQTPSETPEPVRSVSKFVEAFRSTSGTIREAPPTLSTFSESVRSIQTANKSPSDLQPTDEQKAILSAAIKSPSVLALEAGAGTGKTSTLRLIGDILPGNGQYTAFNTALVAESKEKFIGTRVSCNTTHSLAFRSEGKKFSHRLNGVRTRSEQIAQMLGIEEINLENRRLASGFLASQVIGTVRRFCQSADREIDQNHFKYIDGIDIPSSDGRRTYDNNLKVREYLLPYARKAWDDLSREDGQLPFAHDYYVKSWQLNKPVIAADYILLDEAQDTAPVMLDILKQQVCPIILVGDTCQQIYEWRGAINAMAAFPNAETRFLTQSFRFGQAIADVANKVLSSLSEPAPLRLKGRPDRHSKIETLADPTAILTRTNALAVASLLEAIAYGKKPFLVGGSSDVITFIEGAQALQEQRSTGHPDLACFNSWSEVQEYASQDEGQDLRLMVKLINKFGCKPILEALRNMPSEESANIVISTAHKSKGRQWDKVKLASDFPTLSKSNDGDLRLLYVALTRAKFSLDVSHCPFFTGQDSMDLSAIKSKHSESRPTVEGILPSAPSAPLVAGNKPAPTQFTWQRNPKGESWLIRGPKGFAKTTVSVVRKDSSSQQKYLSSVESEGPEFSLYRTY